MNIVYELIKYIKITKKSCFQVYSSRQYQDTIDFKVDFRIDFKADLTYVTQKTDFQHFLTASKDNVYNYFNIFL